MGPTHDTFWSRHPAGEEGPRRVIPHRRLRWLELLVAARAVRVHDTAARPPRPEIVPGRPDFITGEPPRAQLRHDQPRELVLQRFIVQAKALQARDPHVPLQRVIKRNLSERRPRNHKQQYRLLVPCLRDKDIGLCEQGPHRFQRRWVLQVEGDALLAAIEADITSNLF